MNYIMMHGSTDIKNRYFYTRVWVFYVSFP